MNRNVIPSPSETMSTYYVVPRKPATGDKFEHCDYYTASWQPVSANELDANAQGFTTDFVHLVQPTKDQLVAAGIDPSKVDLDATLFAAVAKTLAVDLLLPNLFIAAAGAMVVPVAAGTRRGLILVFARQVNGIGAQLIASTDPEIQNSGVDPRGAHRTS